MGQPPLTSWPNPDQPSYGAPAGVPGQPTPAHGQGAQEPQVPPVPQMPAPQHSFAPPSGQSMYGNHQPAAQAAQQQGGYGSFTFPVAPRQKLEPLAIAGIATAPLGPVGIGLGLLARNRVKQTRRRSMALAWTAVALGAVFTVGWALVTAVLSMNGTIDRALESPQPGDVAAARTVAAANLAVGNCIQTLPPAEQVGEVRLVPCADEHIAQVVSLHPGSGDFPGAEQIAADATATCTTEVENIDAGDASFVPWYLVPSQAGWDQGNTQVVCLLRGDAGPLNVDLVNT